MRFVYIDSDGAITRVLSRCW